MVAAVVRAGIALMLGFAFTSLVQADDARLKIGESFRAAQTEQTTIFSLPAETGDYLRGRLDAGNEKLTLDLVAAEGTHIRRLADKAGGSIEFRIVIGQTGERLKVTSERSGVAFALTLLDQVTPKQQIAPQARPSSLTLSKLVEELEEGGSVEAFWERQREQGTPLVEKLDDKQSLVTFLQRGAKRNVRLFGAPSGDHELLERLGQSDIWFKSFVVPNGTRLSYQIAPDVPDLPGSDRDRRVAILATAQADPLNPRRWPEGAPDVFNQDSILELPDAPDQPGIEEKGAAKGSLSSFNIASELLGNEREITIYTPPGFDAADPQNRLLFLFDARQYMTKVPTPTILDNLISENLISPTVAVFVSEIDRESRSRELPANAGFADFMAKELLPEIKTRTGLNPGPDRTILAGSSYGGLAAATIALRHPESFGNVLSLSGSFWWHPENTPASDEEYVAGLVAGMQAMPVRFQLTAGLFETAHTGAAGILETSRHLRDVLVARGYQVGYREYAGGHDYYVWRGALGDGLIALEQSPR
jgi:enterochelin esterase-like enzyme